MDATTERGGARRATLDELRVHPSAELFPLLDGDELEALVDDIARNGLNEPVWVYEDPERGTVLLDGRNRLTACEMTGVEVRFRHYTGDDPVGFVISQNLHRRHLSAGQRAAVAYELLPLVEEDAKRRQREGARRSAERPRDERGRLQVVENLPEPSGNAESMRSRDRAGTMVGVSGKSVTNYRKVAEEAPDLAQKVKSGEIPLDRAQRIVRDRDAERRRIDEARRDGELSGFEGTVDIRHGDFRDVLADVTDINAVITDIPYSKEFLPVLPDLAAWADKVLAPDGVFVVLSGETYLPDVFRLLDGYRPYRWTACLLGGGPGYNSFPRRVQSKWKPLLVYGGGRRVTDDVIRCVGEDATAKEYHQWGQDLGAFRTIVERLTLPGQTVCDPLGGSGTTLAAAHALGRHVIGCDIDPGAVETMRARLVG